MSDEERIGLWEDLSAEIKVAIIVAIFVIVIVLPSCLRGCCCPLMRHFGCLGSPRGEREGSSASTSIEIEIKRPSAPKDEETGYYKSNITYPTDQLGLEMTKNL